MWDDEINKNIRDAADQYHPAYGENAWEKMEVLLDKHLPVENKRKRKYFYFFAILSTLLIAGSLLGIYVHKSAVLNIQKNVITKSKFDNSTLKNKAKKSMLAETNLPDIEGSQAGTATPLNNSLIRAAKKKINFKESSSSAVNAYVYKAHQELPHHNFAKDINDQGKIKPGMGDNGNVASPETTTSSLNDKETNYTKNVAEDMNGQKQQTTINEELKTQTLPSKKNVTDKKNFAKNNKGKIKGPDKKFQNNFSVGFSAGPDISSTGLNQPGKVSINYGVGASYNISGRFTLHSGFYVSEKIYSAGKNDYHLPVTSNPNYLYNISANCKVYEIPVTVSYNFGKHKNHQWFVNTGLSTYLMKKESYEYYYKYPSGYVDSKSWSISNQNQHYFAIMDISGGYSYSFNKKLSLTTEPYLKIPLAGVGAGKVKLRSAGILFTLNVKPFYNR